MGLYYRCLCTEILEAPDGTQGAKALCPACGKVLVIPKDAVQVSTAEKEQARMMVSSGRVPRAPAAMAAAAAEETLDIFEPGPEVEAAVPEALVVAGEDESFGDLVDEVAQMQVGPAAPAKEEVLLPELPEIPEIPAPVVAKTPRPVPAGAPAARTPRPVAVPAAPKTEPRVKTAAAAPGAVKQAVVRAPIKAGARPAAASSRRIRKQHGEAPCPECGTQVPKGTPVCPQCGHRFKIGGALKWLLLFFGVIILLVAGLVATGIYAPASLPAFVREPLANIGDKLRDIGVPLPVDFARVRPQPARGQEPLPPSEAPAAPATPEAKPAAPVTDVDLEPEIVVPEEAPAAAPEEEEAIVE